MKDQLQSKTVQNATIISPITQLVKQDLQMKAKQSTMNVLNAVTHFQKTHEKNKLNLIKSNTLYFYIIL